MAEKKFARRQYYINKRFQTGFIVKFVLVLVLGAVLSVAITMLTTQQTLTSTFEGSKLVIEKTSFAIMWPVIMTNIVTTAFIGVVAVIITLLVSHKIAGPMFRFEKDLEEISRGNLSKTIHIRKGDQFAEVAENLNGMVININGKLKEVCKELDELVDKAEGQELSGEFVDDLKACKENLENKFQLQK